jgi:hypothetical protein
MIISSPISKSLNREVPSEKVAKFVFHGENSIDMFTVDKGGLVNAYSKIKIFL